MTNNKNTKYKIKQKYHVYIKNMLSIYMMINYEIEKKWENFKIEKSNLQNLYRTITSNVFEAIIKSPNNQKCGTR